MPRTMSSAAPARQLCAFRLPRVAVRVLVLDAVSILASIAGGIIDMGIFGPESRGVVGPLLGLALIAPDVSVTIRRLHDLDRRWPWFLIVFTGIGAIVLPQGHDGTESFRRRSACDWHRLVVVRHHRRCDMKVLIERHGRRREVSGWRKWAIAVPGIAIAALLLAVAVVLALGLALTIGVILMVTVPAALILAWIAFMFGGFRMRTTFE
jgi:uncharacterized membrane protein YhaH (DUF805 family)